MQTWRDYNFLTVGLIAIMFFGGLFLVITSPDIWTMIALGLLTAFGVCMGIFSAGWSTIVLTPTTLEYQNGVFLYPSSKLSLADIQSVRTKQQSWGEFLTKNDADFAKILDAALMGDSMETARLGQQARTADATLIPAFRKMPGRTFTSLALTRNLMIIYPRDGDPYIFRTTHAEEIARALEARRITQS